MNKKNRSYEIESLSQMQEVLDLLTAAGKVFLVQSGLGLLPLHLLS